MTTKFHTNIDCMKKFMVYPSTKIQPRKGDLVEVYRDTTGFTIELEVHYCTWRQNELFCELGLPKAGVENLAQFIDRMRQYGIY